MNIPKISFQTNSKVNSNFNKSFYGSNTIKTLEKDTVSFTSKANEITLSENNQKALQVSDKLIQLAKNNNLNFETIEKTLNENSPILINLHNINELSAGIKNMTTSNILAHMLPGYSEELNCVQANIYIKDIPKTEKEMNELIAHIAHEYTHVLQRTQDDTYYGFKNKTKDYQEIILLAREAQKTMQTGLRELSKQFAKSTQSQADKIKSKRLENPNFIKRQLKPVRINALTKEASEKLSPYSFMETKEIEELIKNWIKQELNNEIEAYVTTIATLEKSGNFNPLNKASALVNIDVNKFLLECMN